MGTIAQAFESGGQTAKEGLFSRLVLLSRADGVVDPTEIKMLERVAQRFSLTPEQAKAIISNPEDYPMVPPVQLEERIEQLIGFVRLAFVDGVVDESEQRLINRYAIGLGFSTEDAESNSAAILENLKAGKSIEQIVASLS